MPVRVFMVSARHVHGLGHAEQVLDLYRCQCRTRACEVDVQGMRKLRSEGVGRGCRRSRRKPLLSERREQSLAIPGASLATIADSGHYPHLEQPEAVLRRVTEFLAGAAP